MATNQIRQSSLILGGGPGSLSVLQDGATVLVPGIDTWYVSRKSPYTQRVPDEAIIFDPLLQKALGVKHFVVPPAEGLSEDDDTDYVFATLFPTWLICYSCHSMTRVVEPNRVKCNSCSDTGKTKRKMVQTNFVIACEDGHLDEFPWLEWVHKGAKKICSNPALKFKANGVVQLSKQTVSCICGAKRNLAGTTKLEGNTSELSSNLEPGNPFNCAGASPWLNQKETACGKPVRMVFRSSSNIYFAVTESSILVPEHAGANHDLIELLSSSNSAGKYPALLLKKNFDYAKVSNLILEMEEEHYSGVSSEELAAALEIKYPKNSDDVPDLDEISSFDRSPEWTALRTPGQHPDLTVRKLEISTLKSYGFETLNAVPRLKKTTALKGFTRLNTRDISPGFGRGLLRRNPPGPAWLPAIQQVGEGIFIEFSLDFINTWIANTPAQARVDIIARNLLAQDKTIKKADPSVKFVLLHTLTHILIQELVIECGYTAASLAERIYSDEDQAGILIYTASTSADGTMGGLVGMSDPKTLARVLGKAIERARWCSNDPVCLELGHLGQGNYGSNLAACHTCCLLPETACDYFNMGLDRGLVIGDSTTDNGLVGYIDYILEYMGH